MISHVCIFFLLYQWNTHCLVRFVQKKRYVCYLFNSLKLMIEQINGLNVHSLLSYHLTACSLWYLRFGTTIFIFHYFFYVQTKQLFQCECQPITNIVGRAISMFYHTLPNRLSQLSDSWHRDFVSKVNHFFIICSMTDANQTQKDGQQMINYKGKRRE
jgi:hypothetical protein